MKASGVNVFIVVFCIVFFLGVLISCKLLKAVAFYTGVCPFARKCATLNTGPWKSLSWNVIEVMMSTQKEEVF
jgi:hypothetical protein